jgi:predicted DNA-binding transcriptional regulator AlpA
LDCRWPLEKFEAKASCIATPNRRVGKKMNENRFPNWPRGLSRFRAAAYVGVSPGIFDRLVAEGKLPKPRSIYHLRRWDLRAIDRALDALFGSDGTPDGAEEIEFEAGPPLSDWPILTRPLRTLQERALLHMYEFRGGRFFCADGCGPKTYAALADLGLAEIVDESATGKMPVYRLTNLGAEKGKYLKERG